MAHIVSIPPVSPRLEEKQKQKQKLVYNNALDTSCIQNILLISCKVVESQQFFDSVNSNTFPIIYSPKSAKNELLELLRNKFKNGIKRIGFAFHDPLNGNEYFLDNKSFFYENDLIENQTTFSENVSFLTDLINEFKVENCEFLACNSLQYSNWKKYYELLNKMTNVTCGASNDKTGNVKYGADWVMENTNENVKDIYFTNSIDNYTSSLVTFNLDDLSYSTSESNATVTGFYGASYNFNLTIPSTVTYDSETYTVTGIGEYAFYYVDSLISITIGSEVTGIGEYAFDNANNLTSITIDSNNQNYSDINGVLFNKDQTILIYYPRGKLDTSYTIPGTVTTIGNNAFQICYNLTSVIIPDSVTIIGSYAFEDCSSLTSVIIPDSVTIIGEVAFRNCNNCQTITIGSAVETIGYDAFENCESLTSVIIPDSVTYIGDDVFRDCYSLISVTIGSGITIISEDAFENCNSLTSVIIPDTVTIIHDDAFRNCENLTSVTIGSGVTIIYDEVFENCYALSNVIIGSGVTYIGDDAFRNCDSLTSVYFMGNIPSINTSGNFYSNDSDTAYIMSTATLLDTNAPAETTVTDYLSPYFFTNVVIIDSSNSPTTPTIQPWYPSGILKRRKNIPFALTVPSSNSSGAFTYTSSNISVATIIDNVVTIVGVGTSTITALQASDDNYLSGDVTTTLTVEQGLPSSNICFRKGTPIRTDQGLIHIDKINTDIHTIRNKNIVAITKTVTQDNYLVCFEKDSLGHNMPSQKTVISANHKIFNKGRMIKAKEFIGKYENIYKVKYSGEVLYNVLMEEYDKIVVNNLICESLHPENAIAKLYKFLEGFNLEQQEEIIKKFNEITIEKHISSSISSKR